MQSDTSYSPSLGFFDHFVPSALGKCKNGKMQSVEERGARIFLQYVAGCAERGISSPPSPAAGASQIPPAQRRRRVEPVAWEKVSKPRF